MLGPIRLMVHIRRARAPLLDLRLAKRYHPGVCGLFRPLIPADGWEFMPC